MINLMYVSCPIRITGEKDGEKVKSYLNINGTTNYGFSEEDYKQHKKQVYNKFASLGWKNINIAPCAKEEFETGTEAESSQIGYFEVYLRADLENNGEEVAYVQFELSFEKFPTEEIFDLLRKQAFLAYSGSGYKIKNIDCCTKEEYDLVSLNDEDPMFEYSWDDRNKSHLSKLE